MLDRVRRHASRFIRKRLHGTNRALIREIVRNVRFIDDFHHRRPRVPTILKKRLFEKKKLVRFCRISSHRYVSPGFIVDACRPISNLFSPSLLFSATLAIIGERGRRSRDPSAR